MVMCLQIPTTTQISGRNASLSYRLHEYVMLIVGDN
jgi:hypothetical protein